MSRSRPSLLEPATGPGDWRDHRVLRRLVDALAWVTWREIAIDDIDATADGPVLLVANHFGGVSDAIILMSVLPRRPRILADDSIWKFPIVKQIMNSIGAIPVHRGKSGKTDNTDMFASAHEALAERQVVLIFPEGITREDPSIGKVRSGAARIALGARAAGVRGIRIIPVGIHYDDKAAFRSSVYVREGQPIDIDAEVAEAGAVADIEGDTDANSMVGPGELQSVDHLTHLIEQRLRESAPDFDDWREARALQMASEVFLRSLEPTLPVSVALRDRLASWLARQDSADEVVDVADRYRTTLAQLGANDSWAAHGPGLFSRRRALTLITWLVMLPYALLGLVAWTVPSVITWSISRIRLAPAVMATVLPLVALLFFGSTSGFWMWVGWRNGTWTGVAAAVTVLPIALAALGLVTERGLLWIRWFRNRVNLLGGRRGRVADLRAETVSAVARCVLVPFEENELKQSTVDAR